MHEADHYYNVHVLVHRHEVDVSCAWNCIAQQRCGCNYLAIKSYNPVSAKNSKHSLLDTLSHLKAHESKHDLLAQHGSKHDMVA